MVSIRCLFLVVDQRLDEAGDAFSSSEVTTLAPISRRDVSSNLNLHLPSIQKDINFQEAYCSVSEDERVAVLLETAHCRHVEQWFGPVEAWAKDL